MCNGTVKHGVMATNGVDVISEGVTYIARTPKGGKLPPPRAPVEFVPKRCKHGNREQWEAKSVRSWTRRES